MTAFSKLPRSDNPIENAVEECANGILKTEWLYKMDIATRDECRDELEQIIGLQHQKSHTRSPELSGDDIKYIS